MWRDSFTQPKTFPSSVSNFGSRLKLPTQNDKHTGWGNPRDDGQLNHCGWNRRAVFLGGLLPGIRQLPRLWLGPSALATLACCNGAGDWALNEGNCNFKQFNRLYEIGIGSFKRTPILSWNSSVGIGTNNLSSKADRDGMLTQQKVQQTNLQPLGYNAVMRSGIFQAMWTSGRCTSTLVNPRVFFSWTSLLKMTWWPSKGE